MLYTDYSNFQKKNDSQIFELKQRPQKRIYEITTKHGKIFRQATTFEKVLIEGKGKKYCAWFTSSEDAVLLTLTDICKMVCFENANLIAIPIKSQNQNSNYH